MIACDSAGNFSPVATGTYTYDGTSPTVTNVTSSTANGTYGIGSVISIQVVFSETVIVTGTPTLKLETGTTDEVVNYASGSNSNTLTFNYTVSGTDTSSDLDYWSTGALSLNGGSIQDVATNNATLTLASPGASGSLGANKAIVIDTTPVSGGVDGTFNGTGSVTTGIGSTNLVVRAMKFQSNGKIVVAGSYASGSTTDFMVARYNTDGTLDTSFGSSGITHSAIGSGTNTDIAYDLAIDSSDKIYLVGSTKVSASVNNWAIARYTSSGSLDTSFDTDGIVTFKTASIGGDSGETGGVSTYSSEARGVTIDPNGKIVVVGFVEATYTKLRNNFAIVRLTTSGALDSSSAGGNTPFNTSGYQVFNFNTNNSTGTTGDIAQAVLIDTAYSNKIVVGGQADIGSGSSSKLNFGILRLPADGGAGTSATSAFVNGNTADVATCIAIDSNNKVLLGGYTGTTKQFGVMRFQANSTSLDTANFNSGATNTVAGTFRFAIGTTDDQATRVAADSSNRILLGGWSKNASGYYDFAVARVLAASGLDTTFNSTGKKTISITANADNKAYEMKLDSNGKILLGGTTTVSSYTQIAVTRITP